MRSIPRRVYFVNPLHLIRKCFFLADENSEDNLGAIIFEHYINTKRHKDSQFLFRCEGQW
jgi:hypothetical protein